MAYIDSRKQKVHPAVAYLLRKYLQELQQLKREYEDDAPAADATDADATDDGAPRDAFAAFARRHQPRTSMRYAAEQAGVLKAIKESRAKHEAAQKKARAKARPPQADEQLKQDLLEARKKQGTPDFEP